MNTFVTILREYVGEVSLHTLKENFDVVYQVSFRPLDVYNSLLADIDGAQAA